MSAAMRSATIWLTGLTGVGLVALGGHNWWESSRSPNVRIDNADRTIYGTPARALLSVEYVVVNDEDTPLRVVGAESC